MRKVVEKTNLQNHVLELDKSFDERVAEWNKKYYPEDVKPEGGSSRMRKNHIITTRQYEGGANYEDLVRQQLAKRFSMKVWKYRWQPAGNCEIDLVLVKDEFVVVVEIKSQDNPKHRDKAIDQLHRSRRHIDYHFPEKRVAYYSFVKGNLILVNVTGVNQKQTIKKFAHV